MTVVLVVGGCTTFDACVDLVVWSRRAECGVFIRTASIVRRRRSREASWFHNVDTSDSLENA